jgi:hypothetical protein
VRRGLFLVLAALGLAAACGSDELLRGSFEPAPDGGAGSTPTSKPDSSAPPTPKRTILFKNPFGDVAAKDNLVWDGDFEWFSPFGEQYGWADVSVVVTTGTYSRVRVSTECKSGMKCGSLTQNQRIAAVGVAPANGQNVSGSVWVRVPNGDCAGDVRTSLISCDFSGDPDVELLDADGKPDGDGWCHYQGVSGARTHATCLYLEAEFVEGEALVDDAVVRATSDAPTSSGIMNANLRAHVDQARKVLPHRLQPQPPNPALREAFLRWAGRRR